MADITLPVNPASLPTGFCPASYQDLLNTFSQFQSVTLPGSNAGVIASPTKPTDQTAAWLQLDSLGRPVRLYYFAQGAWLSQHPSVPGLTMIWTGVLPDFTTFDGGDANALSPISGPMWQTVLAATFPIGAGTLASGAALAVGTTGGEEKHILSTTEMPPHAHQLTGLKNDNMSRNDLNVLAYPGNTAPFFGNANPLVIPSTSSAGGDPATGTPPIASAPHNNLPPYTVVYFLQRTTRTHYAVQ
jgi:hypothetical protein